MFNPVQFVKDSYGELQKVTWIPRKQMIASTFVVMILILIVSVFISLVDLAVSQIFGIFIRL